MGAWNWELDCDYPEIKRTGRKTYEISRNDS